jgi:hypothetical protein
MLITPLCVHSSCLLKVIVLALVDNTMTLSKNDERTHNGVISIGEQHNNLK